MDAGVFTGKTYQLKAAAEQMKPMIEQFLAEFGEQGASFSMGEAVVEGEIAYTTWTAETSANVYELGSETYVIRNGKIVAQTAAMKVTPKQVSMEPNASGQMLNQTMPQMMDS